MTAPKFIIKERWKQVPKFPHYQVSNLGRVRSLDRVDRKMGAHGKMVTCNRKGKVLSQTNGLYRQVCLCYEGKRRQVEVHVLVAETFIGPKPKGQEVRHKDGNSHNNVARNIHYGTKKQNGVDRCLHGNAAIKLTMEQVLLVKTKYRHGSKRYGITALANRFDVTGAAIRSIIQGRSWVWLNPQNL